MHGQMVAVICGSPEDFILTQFHAYVYTYLLTGDSFRNAPDSHSLMKPVTVPVTRVLQCMLFWGYLNDCTNTENTMFAK